MFLRATRIQTPPDKVGAAIDNFEANIVKNLRSAPGNQGVVLLVDRHSGAALGITYWESAKALAASEQTGAQSRTQATQNVAGTQIVNVERAELMIMDRASAPKQGTFVRLTTVNGDPEKLDAAIVQLRNDVLPLLKAQPGYRATIVSVDRQSGKLSASTVWETRVDLNASESKIAGPRAEVAKIAGGSPQDVQVEIFETAFVELSAAITQTAARA
jgi:heme-degrading monooxygenase HmoA